MIGGIKLMIGNKVVDGSISYQLRKIKYTLEQV
jgi:F0F1-type ATP synthase delta subunit